ncbi:MAG: cation transport regulator [Glomeribacter sp. 1016415]|uniref:Cation transport regulator n=1 Tax=Mycoavidus cysteinexigens TaxID=1553431 RepID=A0A2Z6EU87_9BURK|nr:ChaB family protein [Mycoavidus cysteinexigens]MCX8565377.1 cation transport regulator [Glomeribacter sp. 1016415]BBE08972.1 cation transport regulator [Mycoavidus cysteinexigens]GAM52304.1 cation transport regulator chaB [bacterium endosymbiont of Mortierella elongata FMR23-6]GLR01183.1 cation transport regulator ChaB [Mycoavidus cysteinexigens]
MPYTDIKDLPEKVRAHLPQHAQEIYKAAFNHAWDEYRDKQARRDDASQEETAHKVAWAAVKHVYQKESHSGNWVLKKKSDV